MANKAFDYVQAGIPSLQMAFPEYLALQKEYDCFYLLPDVEVRTIVEQLQSILNAPEGYYQKAANCLQASRIWTWEREEKVLLSLYNDLKTRELKQ